MQPNFEHQTVLLKETVENLLPLSDRHLFDNDILTWVDCTLGGGGHTLYAMEYMRKNGFAQKFKKINLIGIDRDMEAIQAADSRIKCEAPFVFKAYKSNFSDLSYILKQDFEGSTVDALCADLGVSSPQLDHSDRGFSVASLGPLDMRMDKTQRITAEILLQELSESELVKIFKEYGEEPKAKILARRICEEKSKQKNFPWQNTQEFAKFVTKELRYPHSKSNPAYRIFQALRIAVNGELEALETALNTFPDITSKNAKIGFISFHSLEDRIVKHHMRAWEKGEKKSSQSQKSTAQLAYNPMLSLNNSWGKETPRGGIVPTDLEIKENPRARSARLRVFSFAR